MHSDEQKINNVAYIGTKLLEVTSTLFNNLWEFACQMKEIKTRPTQMFTRNLY